MNFAKSALTLVLFLTPSAHSQVTEMMQQALIPAVFIEEGVEKAFKVKLDCTAKTINQARNDAAAAQLLVAHPSVKGWKKTGVETVMGGQGLVFINPKSSSQLAIGSIGANSMYALMICKSNKPLK